MTVTRNYSSGAGAMTLQSGIGTSDTSISVDTVAGLPVAYPYTLFLDYETSSEEIVDVTAAVGTTLTIARGKDGTIAQSHDAGAVVRHGLSARDLRESREHEDATAAHGVGEVVGTTETQSLDNKTFEPVSTDRPALTVRVGPDTSAEPVADFLDVSGTRWGGVYDREVKGLYSGQPLWRLLGEGLATFYGVAASFSIRSAVHAIVATKVTGATGKFLRLLATDGTTETFSVDADGNVAAQNVAVAGTLSGPTVTSLTNADSDEAAARAAEDTALSGRVTTLEGREYQHGTATIPFAGTSTESVDVTFPTAFSGTPTVRVTAENVGINVSVQGRSTTGCTIYGRRIEDGATQGSSVTVNWDASYN